MSTSRQAVNAAYAKDVEIYQQASLNDSKRFLSALIFMTPFMLIAAGGSLFGLPFPLLAASGVISIGALIYFMSRNTDRSISETWKPLMKQHLATLNVDVNNMEPSLEDYKRPVPVSRGLYEPAVQLDESIHYQGNVKVDGRFVDLTIKDIKGSLVPLVGGRELTSDTVR